MPASSSTTPASMPVSLTRWIVSVIVAEAIGFGLAMGLGRGIYALVGGEPPGVLGELFVLGLSTLAGVVEGLCLGAGQWRVLRTVVPGVSARAWLGATATGGALAWILGMSAGTHGPRSQPVPWVMAIALIGSGLLLGALLGGVQAVVLRRRPWLARAWIVANAIGWTIGLLFAYAGIAQVHGGASTWAGFGVLAVSGAAMAVVPALATGLALRMFVARRDR